MEMKKNAENASPKELVALCAKLPRLNDEIRLPAKNAPIAGLNPSQNATTLKAKHKVNEKNTSKSSFFLKSKNTDKRFSILDNPMYATPSNSMALATARIPVRNETEGVSNAETNVIPTIATMSSITNAATNTWSSSRLPNPFCSKIRIMIAVLVIDIINATKIAVPTSKLKIRSKSYKKTKININLTTEKNTDLTTTRSNLEKSNSIPM